MAASPQYRFPPSSETLSLRDFYLPTLTPDQILDTLDHLASLTPKKKSHARKQPAGHIPRPRNAFILFRCLFVSQQAVPASVEKDHRNISRIAGRVWKSMSNQEREPWVKASDLEKTRHEAKWPGYRYNPIQSSQPIPRRFPITSTPRPQRTKQEDNDDEDWTPTIRDGRCARVANLVREGKKGRELEDALCGKTFDVFSSTDNSNPTTTPVATTSPPLDIVWPFPNMSSYYSGVHDLQVPPDTPESTAPSQSMAPPPPPPPTHSRLAQRRSSSCPPLPPISFSFSNPNPWSVASSSPSAALSAFAGGDTSEERERTQTKTEDPEALVYPTFAMPTPLPVHFPTEDHRLHTNASHHSHPPRLNLDTSSRLVHRRGSSLDRAIASSSIAGVFGSGSALSFGFGSATSACSTPGHQYGGYTNSYWSGTPTPDSGVSTPPDFDLDTDLDLDLDPDLDGGYSSSSGTPSGVPLTPQSSFDSVCGLGSTLGLSLGRGLNEEKEGCEEELRPRGRSEAPRALSLDVRGPSAVSGLNTPSSLPPATTLSPRSPQSGASGTPPPSSPPSATSKIPARLFGSQGVRLGIDLDLDLGLDLDVELVASGRARGPVDISFVDVNVEESAWQDGCHPGLNECA